MSLAWAWLDDGPLRARRYPFIYLGAVISVSRITFSHLTLFLPAFIHILLGN